MRSFFVLPFWIRISGLILVLFLCWITVLFINLRRHENFKKLSSEVFVLLERAEALEKQKKFHQRKEKQNPSASKEYLKLHAETLLLLQEEKERVTALSKQFPSNNSLRERLIFLEGEGNKIKFESSLNGSFLEYHLARPVQMDLKDLRKFLETVETERYDATQMGPFLAMKKFDLTKCYEKGDEKVYSIYAELLEK